MAIDFEVGMHRRCRLYTQHEYRGNAFNDEVRSGRRLIMLAASSELTQNRRQLAQLIEFIRNAPGCAYANDAAPEHVARALQTAVERGDVIAVASAPHSSRGASVPVQQLTRPYYATVTPSQLLRREPSVVRAARSFERPKLPRLPAEDGLAIWYARPGDVLPDGSIAKPVSTPLGNALPFDYTPKTLSDDGQEFAARGVRMTGNEPGGFRVNPNGFDVDYFDSNGNLCAQYHASHGEPHGHNFSHGKRDNAHLPMSPINCR